MVISVLLSTACCAPFDCYVILYHLCCSSKFSQVNILCLFLTVLIALLFFRWTAGILSESEPQCLFHFSSPLPIGPMKLFWFGYPALAGCSTDHAWWIGSIWLFEAVATSLWVFIPTYPHCLFASRNWSSGTWMGSWILLQKMGSLPGSWFFMLTYCVFFVESGWLVDYPSLVVCHWQTRSLTVDSFTPLSNLCLAKSYKASQHYLGMSKK